jgi:hypothetical protein
VNSNSDSQIKHACLLAIYIRGRFSPFNLLSINTATKHYPTNLNIPSSIEHPFKANQHYNVPIIMKPTDFVQETNICCCSEQQPGPGPTWQETVAAQRIREQGMLLLLISNLERI